MPEGTPLFTDPGELMFVIVLGVFALVCSAMAFKYALRIDLWRKRYFKLHDYTIELIKKEQQND